MSYILAEHFPELNGELRSAIEVATKIVKRNTQKYGTGDLYPADAVGGTYTAVKQCDKRSHFWLEGFWPGQLWLTYELTKDEDIHAIADKYVEDFYKRVYENNNIDWHHDTGFLYTPSCVSGYKVAGNETAKKAALMAAYSLSRRFRYKGEFIQSMLTELDENRDFYKFIVDTMMNLPLLFWATEETGDSIYREKAIRHLNTTIKYAMREDGTTFHHILMDNQTGEMIRGLTWQGASDDSCWSRGQAWVVYGLAIAYAYTKDESLIPHFCKVTDYFINHLPADDVPYWDFVYSDGDGQPRDSSAAAIAVCGILEMAKHVNENEYGMKNYIDKAKDMLVSLMRNYASTYESGDEGLILHGTVANPQGMADSATQFGDYFYLEALLRASSDWNPYW